MAVRRGDQLEPAQEALHYASTQLGRVANLLALIAIKGEAQTEKMRILAGAGFSIQEISQLLHTSRNNVSVQLHRTRRRSSRKRSRRGT